MAEHDSMTNLKRSLVYTESRTNCLATNLIDLRNEDYQLGLIKITN